jgi:hypothetical protein
LKEDEKAYAIYGHPSNGVGFGRGIDILVRDQCNLHSSNSTSRFGQSYMNDSGLSGERVFTGGSDFKVQEIEVFELST